MYAVSGDSQAHAIHLSHRQNPAVANRIKSVCILDGNSEKSEDEGVGVIKLPGQAPEVEVFDFVRENIGSLSMRLAVGLHLAPEKDSMVASAVEQVSRANRDPHLLFNQVGQATGLVPANIVSSAFIGLWLSGKQEQAARITRFIKANLDAD